MLDKLIEISLRERLVALIILIGITLFGIYRYNKLPVDAFPDISPIMASIFAEAHGMAPEEIERLITFPIETAMNGLPSVTQIKSTSAFGLAVIYVYFEDDVDIYFARQIVAERLASAMADLPDMHEPPALGPISTGLGQIFMYYLTLDKDTDTGGKEPNTYLREINDWVVKFQLQTVTGVTDILSVGGHVLQYQIQVSPDAMNQYQIGLEDVVAAIQDNNRNAGGQFLVIGQEEYLVRGLGLLQNLEDIRNLQIKVVNGSPIRVSDVARVDFGNEIRRGVATRNGEEEVVSGIVLQLFGENTSAVIGRLYEKIPDLQASLPEGVTIVPYYEQAELVKHATDTVKSALLIGGVLVLVALLIFLGNFRTAFIVALALPLCALIAVIFMGIKGLSANLMSLGGIAIGIGMLGDGAIVMVENIYRQLGDPTNAKREKLDIIKAAAHEVGRPIVFSIAIIIIVFLPIFTLQDVEGKMFTPLAFTITFALIGSIFAALVMAPVLSSYLLKSGTRKEPAFLDMMKNRYRNLVNWSLKHKKLIVTAALISFIAAIGVMPFLGAEFIPTLEEGSILIGVAMAPSISLEKATQTTMQLERQIMAYPEVTQTVSRIGRPEAGSHPHPVNYAEVHIDLTPKSTWRFSSKEELIQALNDDLKEYPGVQLSFTQPIQNAFDELLSGVKTQLAIKLFGEDLTVMQTKATEIRNVIDTIPGLVDLSVEQSFGQPQVQVIANRDACARYGVTVADVLELVELAIGGEVIDQLYLNTRRFGIFIRYQEPYRVDTQAIRQLLVHTADSGLIPLAQIADVQEVIGPIQINREKNQRRWIIQANVRGRDMGGVVSDIRERIAEKIDLPPGYYLEYGGQFENQQRAMKRLSVIVPLAIGLIFFMLFLTFDNFRHAFLIIINVPMALIGGVFGLLITGEYLSVPASVGFIALFGIAMQNGVVLVSTIKQYSEQGLALDRSIIEAAIVRLRPVLMTAFTTILGLLPLLISTGIGSEVQRPLAIVIVFGLLTSTLLTLIVIPALYEWFVGRT
ncbi:MAG: hypothetical protein B6244_10765 [Candidatus Cloacimonetes bacterium 4572_55]|nr:MAG: hypothetical protein B6244_10765 [Candidatus Cloacimonetes bacterium 4572_55]